MTEHQIHDRLPSGFAYANAQQAEAFTATGSVAGASKVAYVRNGDEVDLAVRLRPPHKLEHIRSTLGRNAVGSVEKYVSDYNAGWAASKREFSSLWDSGDTAHSWDDGYLDYAAGRPKWHLTYCLNHDECGEG